MLEVEAQGKWCPMVRVMGVFDLDGTREIITNRGGFSDSSRACLGIECAMWVRTDPGRGYCGFVGQWE